MSLRRGWGLAGLGVAFAVVLLSRRPGVLLHPAFWCEDGWVFYPDAWRWGWRALFIPDTGYLQFLSSAVALMAQGLPLAWAPASFAVVALLVQLAPALFLLSPRMDAVWPSLPGRLLFVLFYLGLPNSYAVYVNLSNAMWYLALFAFLVLVAPPRRAWAEALALGVAVVSGPFCLFLLPVAAALLLWRRGVWDGGRLAIVAAGVVVQLGFMAASLGATRSVAPLGAGVLAFGRIVGSQVFAAGLIGEHGVTRLWLGVPAWGAGWLPLGVSFLGLALGLVSLWLGRLELRLFGLFAGLMLAGALWHPQAALDQPQWPVLAWPGSSDRYWLVPMLAWLLALFNLAAGRTVFRGIALGLLALLCVGIPWDWEHPYMPPVQFGAVAEAFARAAPGAVVVFPVNPPGAKGMTLEK